MTSFALASPFVVACNALRFPLLLLLVFFLFSADAVSLLLSFPRCLPFLIFLVFVFVRLAFDFLAFYRILPPQFHLAHFMFPRIPNDPVTFFLVPEPTPPPFDPGQVNSRISWEISKEKFNRDRAKQQARLLARAERVKAIQKAKDDREAAGIFGPMDERYFPKHRPVAVRKGFKRATKWDCLRQGVAPKPSKNYGGGTVVRRVNAVRGHVGQLIPRKKPVTLMPWPQPKEVSVSRHRLKKHLALHPFVVEEVKRNMAKAEAERKSQIPPPHLKGVARAYWLIQMKRRLTKPYFVNPLYDEKSELTKKAPDGRIYDSSDYESCD